MRDQRVIQPGDIVYSIGEDPIEYFYVQPLIIKEVLDNTFIVEADEELVEVSRDDFLFDEKAIQEILIRMLKNVYREKKEIADEVKEQLTLAKNRLKELKKS